MESIKQFDEFLKDLYKKIESNPKMKKDILNQAIEKTKCPYLQESIKSSTDYFKGINKKYQ